MNTKFAQYLLVLSIIFMTSCVLNEPYKFLPSGTYRAELDLGKEKLPFNFELHNEEDGKVFWLEIINGEERLRVDEVIVTADSIFIKMPIFESEIRAKLNGGNMIGLWHNYYKGDDYVLGFTATYNDTYRFSNKVIETPMDVSGNWEVTFEDSSKALGIFTQKGDIVDGTFLTNTGDYRFLAGQATENKMMLSCFDGSHAFLFTSKVQEDGSLFGFFLSGNHYRTSWTAVRNDDFKLADAFDLTYVNEGATNKFDFAFPNEKGDTISINDAQFEGKPMIVQILGSWCPNCMDETAFLSEFNRKNKDISVVGLAFERTTEPTAAFKNINRLKERFDVEYPMLLGGRYSKKEASELFPQLNKIISFPTTIYLNKNKEVVKIHTGFSGPATGQFYDDFIKEHNAIVAELTAE